MKERNVHLVLCKIYFLNEVFFTKTSIIYIAVMH
jgi:hypothetical protein